MAVGTKAGLLDDDEPLQSALKHMLLSDYVIVFAQKLANGTASAVALIDGYAGAGRYQSGTPGSADLLLQAAQAVQNQKVRVELVERDPKYQSRLKEVIADYAPENPNWGTFSPGRIEDHLPEIRKRNRNCHQFWFLDPCGAGLSYQNMCNLMAPRGRLKTEVLFNLSADVIRRAGAWALARETDSGRPESETLTRVLGGDWWVEAMKAGRKQDDSGWGAALEKVVTEFERRIAEDSKSIVASVPVRKKSTHKQPTYYLIFMTMSETGLWVFNDALTRALRKGDKIEMDRGLVPMQGSLFDLFPEDLIANAKEILRKNVLKELKLRDLAPVRDYSTLILSGIMGSITSTEIGQELRDMEKEGLIGLAKNKKPEKYRVFKR